MVIYQQRLYIDALLELERQFFLMLPRIPYSKLVFYAHELESTKNQNRKKNNAKPLEQCPYYDLRLNIYTNLKMLLLNI